MAESKYSPKHCERLNSYSKLMINAQPTKPNTPSRNFRGGDRRGGGRPPRAPREQLDYNSAVLHIARVARVTKGGKRFSFRATVIAGDGKGKVGVGIGKGIDVSQSIQKATNQARKNMIKVAIEKGTIAHEVQNKYNSATVMLKPAIIGKGVKAGGPVRVIAKLAGIENLIAKILSRSTNKINIARATIGALSKLKASN